MKIKKTYLYIGTTAELIKLVPLIKELNKRKITFVIIASGQNTIKFEEFSHIIGDTQIIHAITPKGDESSVLKFVIWSIRTFFSLLVWMRRGFNGLNKSNCYFIVHGDTVSSLMGALAAYVYGLTLVHIESGLRSFNFLEPFPEEICRSIISKIADIHCCPNEWSLNNLSSFSGKKINTKENTLIEVFWNAMKTPPNILLLNSIWKQKKKYFVMVSHRQEHVIFNKAKTQEILTFIIDKMPKNIVCLFVMHDLSTEFIHEIKTKLDSTSSRNVILTKRLPYVEYMHLISKAEFMITDGGSNQEEMYYMGKPCLLLRNYTERIEGLNRNIVLSKNKKDVISSFLTKYTTYNSTPVTYKKSPSSIIVNSLFP